ncbi:hypothetical protein HanIR_Chr17g0878221 [Helianthus annuus]|nr:hypothetical protein HanIR_Chr17g0878221 [Helianthus annuus]
MVAFDVIVVGEICVVLGTKIEVRIGKLRRAKEEGDKRRKLMKGVGKQMRRKEAV